jgi:hypothetical protein
MLHGGGNALRTIHEHAKDLVATADRVFRKKNRQNVVALNQRRSKLCRVDGERIDCLPITAGIGTLRSQPGWAF